MKIDIVSVFPEYFEVMNLSLMGKAQAKGLLEIKAHNLRDWTHDVHHSVDDTPVGGGADQAGFGGGADGCGVGCKNSGGCHGKTHRGHCPKVFQESEA